MNCGSLKIARDRHFDRKRGPRRGLLDSHNMLCNPGDITAVVNWEDSGYGDPGVDVAYCRMELFLEGMNDAADEFLLDG